MSARSYTFSRNPAPSTLDTSYAAPITLCTRSFKYSRSFAFIRGHSPRLLPHLRIFFLFYLFVDEPVEGCAVGALEEEDSVQVVYFVLDDSRFELAGAAAE